MKKFNWKKMIGKSYVVAAGVALTMIPTAASAEAPSAYVNRVTTGLYGEFMAVSFKLAMLAIAACIIGYFMTGDDHKKRNLKFGAISTVICVAVLAALPGILEWFEGLV